MRGEIDRPLSPAAAASLARLGIALGLLENLLQRRVHDFLARASPRRSPPTVLPEVLRQSMCLLHSWIIGLEDNPRPNNELGTESHYRTISARQTMGEAADRMVTQQDRIYQASSELSRRACSHASFVANTFAPAPTGFEPDGLARKGLSLLARRAQMQRNQAGSLTGYGLRAAEPDGVTSKASIGESGSFAQPIR